VTLEVGERAAKKTLDVLKQSENNDPWPLSIEEADDDVPMACDF
jgi:hypothetical protein